jgi:DNA-binding response OmpR family regulator
MDMNNLATNPMLATSDALGSRQGSLPVKRPKVLVADDDPTVRQSLRHALESENFEVIFAADGNEALEKFYEGYIDIVLLDLKMPGKSGWEVFERMTAVNPLLAVIIITARNGAVELAAEAGATAIMEKPLDLPTLLWTIHRLLREPLDRRLWRIAGHCPLIMVSES